MVTRIQELINKEGVSIRRFEQSINASNGLIRKAIANNTDVQSKWILEIANVYPFLNLEWLIKGEGMMYKSDRSKTTDVKITNLTNTSLPFADNSNNNANSSLNMEIKELKSKIEVLKILMESKEALIESQAETISAKDEIIRIKDKIIKTLLDK